MARTALASVRAMNDSVPDAPAVTGGSPAHPHRTRTRVLADRGLLAHGTVRAAAGTPHTVFPLDPKSLVEYAQGRVVDVRERSE